MAPAGTPPEVVSLLIAEVGKLVKDPALVEKAERAGYEWIGAGPDALQRKMAEEKAQTEEVIRFSGIKPQVDIGCPRCALARRPAADQSYTSTLASSALSWMNSRRGSTSSPISLAEEVVGLVDLLAPSPAAASARSGRAWSPRAARGSSRRGPCSAAASGPCGRRPITASNRLDAARGSTVSSSLRRKRAGLRVDRPAARPRTRRACAHRPSRAAPGR